MMPGVSRPGEANRDASDHRVRVGLMAISDSSCFAILAYLAASRVFFAEFGVGVVFGADRLILLGVAMALLAVRVFATRIDPRLTLAALASLGTLAGLLVVLPLNGVNVENPVRAVLRPVKARLFSIMFGTTRPRGLYRLDNRYGFVHVPGAQAFERRRGYTARYATDAEGNRSIPTPGAPRSTVMFLGDSFTFGAGVSDDQTFSHVLATEHWTDVQVINAGVDGWGLTQMHLRLTDALAKPQLPAAVFTVIIPDDLRRSHLRPPVVPGLTARLEWIGGEWMSSRLVYRSAMVEETPALLEQEARLASATLSAMSAISRARQVAFGVILLDDEGEYPPDMVYALAQSDTAVLDLSRLGQTWLPYDGHPDPAGHRAIADAIASSALTELVYRRAAPAE